MFVFFTELIGYDVIDRHGQWIGRPCDFLASLEHHYPPMTSLVVCTGLLKKKYYIIPWNWISHLNGKFVIKQSLDQLKSCESYDEETGTSLKRAILDQQVVDTFHRKVVRVNDIHFLRVDSELRLAHVDVGFRGLVRRLGFEGVVDRVVRLFHPHARYLVMGRFIAWKYVQPLSIEDISGNLHLQIEQDELSKILPSDLSEIFMDLDARQRTALLKSLDPSRQVEIITEMELKYQKDLFEDLDARVAVELVERMPSDEATDLLSTLHNKDAKRILNQLSPRKAREIAELMTHESDSAGGLMTTEFVTLTAQMAVSDAITNIKAGEFKKVKSETIHMAYVVNPEGHLVGSVNFRRLLIEPMEANISDIMLENPPAAHVEDSLKDVASLFDKYNLFVLPVVNKDGVLEGIITIDDVLSKVIKEAWE